jgi:hypothetical protein
MEIAPQKKLFDGLCIAIIHDNEQSNTELAELRTLIAAHGGHLCHEINSQVILTSTMLITFL